VVQRLVQKEKLVFKVTATIERMEKKYKDKAELVTVSVVCQIDFVGFQLQTRHG